MGVTGEKLFVSAFQVRPRNATVDEQRFPQRRTVAPANFRVEPFALLLTDFVREGLPFARRPMPAWQEVVRLVGIKPLELRMRRDRRREQTIEFRSWPLLPERDGHH